MVISSMSKQSVEKLSGTNMNNYSQINDKSPLRTRRVENYEEVINRLT